MSSIYDWSLTASNNGTADESINWAEGQAPSTVNGSARVMMSRIKEFLLDIGGAPVAAGTANTITVTVNSSFTAYANGIRIALRAVETNTAAATLNVNSIGAKPVVKFTNSGEAPLAGQEIQDNCIHEFIYCSFLNGGSGAWLLVNPVVTAIPPGSTMAYWGGTGSPPNGWLYCDGSARSRTTYSGLFAIIGTHYGVGDGATTFNLPDTRNEFLRGVSSTLTVGTKQSDEIRAHQHNGTTNAAGEHTHPIGVNSNSIAGLSGIRAGNTGPVGYLSSEPAGFHQHTFTTNPTGGSETRPRNIAVNWIIKT